MGMLYEKAVEGAMKLGTQLFEAQERIADLQSQLATAEAQNDRIDKKRWKRLPEESEDGGETWQQYAGELQSRVRELEEPESLNNALADAFLKIVTDDEWWEEARINEDMTIREMLEADIDAVRIDAARSSGEGRDA